VQANGQSRFSTDRTLQFGLVVALVLDCHFKFGPGSDQNHQFITGQFWETTRTVNSCKIQWTSLKLSELGRLSVGPSVDLYNVLVVAVR
jgi:hypothetical protein